jgi:hypothetical protein
MRACQEPRGALTSTSSPSFAPIRARPRGESGETPPTLEIDRISISLFVFDLHRRPDADLAARTSVMLDEHRPAQPVADWTWSGAPEGLARSLRRGIRSSRRGRRTPWPSQSRERLRRDEDPRARQARTRAGVSAQPSSALACPGHGRRVQSGEPTSVRAEFVRADVRSTAAAPPGHVVCRCEAPVRRVDQKLRPKRRAALPVEVDRADLV